MVQAQGLERGAAMHKRGNQSEGPQLEWQAWTRIGWPLSSFVAVQAFEGSQTLKMASVSRLQLKASSNIMYYDLP